jgi:hypothetical protein
VWNSGEFEEIGYNLFDFMPVVKKTKIIVPAKTSKCQG